MVSLAGPVTVTRHGHEVIAHYGSVATEVAVCVKHAGIVQRPELSVFELEGPEAWLDQLPAPAVGTAGQMGGTWCVRTAAGRALVVGPDGGVGGWRRLVQRGAVSGGGIRGREVRGLSAVSLLGPRAAAVLAGAGVCRDLAPGDAVSGTLGGAPAVAVCQARDRFLLLVEAAPTDAAWDVLGAAGAPYGLGRAGHDAYDRLRAALVAV